MKKHVRTAIEAYRLLQEMYDLSAYKVSADTTTFTVKGGNPNTVITGTIDEK